MYEVKSVKVYEKVYQVTLSLPDRLVIVLPVALWVQLTRVHGIPFPSTVEVVRIRWR